MTTEPRNRLGVARFSWAKLEAIKTERGLQWKTIAKNAAITFASIWNWRNGITRPAPAVFRRLAESLGVDPIDLMDGFPEEFSLADYRDMAGYSAAAASQAVGMQSVRVNQLEHREAVLSESDVAKLAGLYGISEQTVRAAYARGRS